MSKYLLFTPGPVNVAENLRAAISKEDICHRETDFDELLAGIEQKLLSLFQIKRPDRYRAVVITGSGTAANEAILSSVVGQGGILILSNGEFGERLHKTSLLHNSPTHLIEMPWGKPFDRQQISSYLEGSNIAFCSSSSSKAIGSYPGLSFVIGRKKQFKKLKAHKPNTTYLNLATFYHFLKTRSQTPNTPAVPLFYALDQALTNILDEGVSKHFATSRARADQLRQGMRKLNLEFLIDESEMCSILTTVKVPKSVSVGELRDRLRDKAIIIYEGKGCFQDKVFQVGNIGEMSAFDIRFFLQTLKDVLVQLQSEAADIVVPLMPTPTGTNIVLIKPPHGTQEPFSA
jgi:2-aminoethylphosphonate-pyruvate transaminase